MGRWCFVADGLLCWLCLALLCRCVNGASPVGFVLSLFYMCEFQMNQVCGVCVVCVWLHPIEVCCLLICL